MDVLLKFVGLDDRRRANALTDSEIAVGIIGDVQS